MVHLGSDTQFVPMVTTDVPTPVDDAVSAVPHAGAVLTSGHNGPKSEHTGKTAVPVVGAALPQYVCTRCGYLVYIPAGVTVPCAWCGGPLVPVVVAGVPVARDKEYASSMR
jgi:hypothetical protein